MTSGFSHGEDFVSAKINFELNPEGLTGMREINSEMERFQVNADAAARSADSFTRYINLMGEAHERTAQSSRNMVALLERAAHLSERMSASTTSTAIPPGYAAPFQGGGAGTGADRGHAPTTVPVQSAWDALAAQDPRAYVNARTAWSGNRPGDVSSVTISEESLDRLAARLSQRDHEQQAQEFKRSSQQQQHSAPRPAKPGKPPWESWRNRAAQWVGGAAGMAGAMGPGGGGALGIAAKGLQGWAARHIKDDPSAPTGPGGSSPHLTTPEGAGPPSVPHMPHGGAEPDGEGGGGMGGLGHLAGWGGAGIGVGAAIFGGIQKAGQQVQQYRALGQVRGGGFSEGFGYETQARMMALNPFITNEQSRSIIQSALTSGYTGQEFDTVTKFMANNLKDMNMSVADSTKILQQSAKGSSESIEDLTKNLHANLGAMKDLSKTGYATLPGREEDLMTAFPSLAGAGMDPQVAAGVAGGLSQAFAGQRGMDGFGGQLGSAVGGSMTFQQMMRAFGGAGGTPLSIPGLPAGDPGAILEALSGQGDKAVADAVWNTLHKLATMSNGNIFVFQGMMRRILGLNLNRQDAKVLYERAMAVGSGGDNDPLNAQKQYDQAQKGEADKESNLSPNQHAQIFNQWQQGHGLSGARLPITGSGTGGGRPGSGNIRDQITNAYGSNAEVGGSGHEWVPFDPTNPDQLKDLQSGKLHVRRHGDKGGGSSLGDLPKGQAGNPDTGTGAGRGPTAHGSGMSGTLTIDVKPANMRSLLNIPTHVPLTANEQQANAGYGTATKNNPPPGDTITSRGARGA